MSTMTLPGIVSSAITDLEQWRADNPHSDEPHDTIFEIADNSVPVYIGDLLRLAADNIHLAVNNPELGPASGSNFDGTPSPVNIIAANVFEHIEAALWDAWREMEDEDTDVEEDAE